MKYSNINKYKSKIEQHMTLHKMYYNEIWQRMVVIKLLNKLINSYKKLKAKHNILSL